MSSPEVQRELGAHDARLKHLDDEVAELRKEMAQVLSILNQTKGSWKTLVAIAGAAGTLGALVSWVIHAIAAVPLK